MKGATTTAGGGGAMAREGDFHSSETARQSRTARRKLALSFGGALFVVVAILMLMQQFFPAAEEGTHRRSSLSTRADGFRGLHDVLGELGFAVERHQRSYGQLPEADQSVLLLLDPLDADVLTRYDSTRMDDAQRRALRQWVEAGGQVVAAPPGRLALEFLGVDLDVWTDDSERNRDSAGEAGDNEGDSDDNGDDDEFDLPGSLRRMFDLGGGTILAAILGDDLPEVEWRRPDGSVRGAGDLDGHGSRWSLLPPALERRLKPYLNQPGGKSLLGASDGADSSPATVAVFARDLPSRFEPVLFLEDRPVTLSTAVGDGRLWLYSSAYPFTNLAMARGGTAPALVDLLARATDSGSRTIYFDEYCHGLWSRRGLFGWVLHTHLFYPIAGVVLVVCLLLWRSAVRPAAAAKLATTARRSKEEYVMSLADIAQRAERYRMAAAAIVDMYKTKVLFRSGTRAGGGRHESSEPQDDLDALARRCARSTGFRAEELRSVAVEAATIYQRVEKPTENEGEA